MFQQKKRKLTAVFLVLALALPIFWIQPDSASAAGGTDFQSVTGNASEMCSHSEAGTLTVWFSKGAGGSAVCFAEPGNTLYLNFRYTGDLKDYKVKERVMREGRVIAEESFTAARSGNIPIVTEETGEYEGTVFLDSGQQTVEGNSFVKSVEGLPHILVQPESVTADVGTEVTFRIETDAEEPSYKWYVKDDPDCAGREISGAAGPVLAITPENVTTDIHGKYFYCLVSANGYTVASDPAVLTLREPGLPLPSPSDTHIPKPIVTAPRSTVTPSRNTPLIAITPSAPSGTTASTTLPTALSAPRYTQTGNPSQYSMASVLPTSDPAVMPTQVSKTLVTVKVRARYRPSKNAIVLTWKKTGDRYRLYRSTKRKGKYRQISTSSKRSYTDKKIKQKKKYFYKLAVYTGNKRMGTSKTVSVRADIRPKLKKFSLKHNHRIVYLSWKFDHVKQIEVYADTGQGFKKAGRIPGIKDHCTVRIASGYRHIRFRIKGYSVIGRKKYYSGYSKIKRVKIV